MYNIFSIIFIVALSMIFIGYIVAICTKVRSKRIDSIRKFKKGNCAVIYLVAIPLYFLGHFYGGEKLIDSIFASISDSLSLVVLGYETSGISKLMEANALYSFAVYFCFVLVTINATLFAISLLDQKLWEWHQRRRWSRSKEEKLLIVGNNEQNLSIYSSATKRATMIIDDISDEEKAKLYTDGICYVSKSFDIECAEEKKQVDETPLNEVEKYCCDLLSDCLSDQRKSCTIVINTKNDDKNIAICHKIISCTGEFFDSTDASVISKNLARIKIYVFGFPAHEAIYNDIVKLSKGCIRYINKYRQIAMDFIDRYPLTQFMTSKQIDYRTSLLRDGVDVNVAMLGFGKTNQQIFLTSVANNQFLTEANGEKILKQVHYHIFDKQHSEENKNLNHSYYRFKNEFKQKIEEQKNLKSDQPYLPFPALPADDHYKNFDINDPSFYEEIQAALSGDGKFNYIIIGFGTDLENIDMAGKLIEKKQEWGLENTYIFVKVRSGNDAYSIFDRDDCFMIGDEKRSVYNIEEIDNNAIDIMAKKRNRIYTLEYEITTNPNKQLSDSVDKVYEKADCDWYIKKTQFERESNLYGCLSLRSKLHLMGFDYVSIDNEEKNALSSAEYLDCYAPDDKPTYYDGILADGKKIVKYDLNFKESRRKTMAVHEHLRWNSFMLSKGFVPSSKAEILKDTKKNGKNYSLRKHGNLTTFEGLAEFRRLIAQRDGKDEIATDVIKYDYQLLDDAHWLLTTSGYKITGRDN